MLELIKTGKAPTPPPASIRLAELVHHNGRPAPLPGSLRVKGQPVFGRCQRCGADRIRFLAERPTRSFWRSWRCGEWDDSGAVCDGLVRRQDPPAARQQAGLPMRYLIHVPRGGLTVRGQKFLWGPAETPDPAVARAFLRAGARSVAIHEATIEPDGRVKWGESDRPVPKWWRRRKVAGALGRKGESRL